MSIKLGVFLTGDATDEPGVAAEQFVQAPLRSSLISRPRRLVGGSGLGLSQVYGFAEGHKARQVDCCVAPAAWPVTNGSDLSHGNYSMLPDGSGGPRRWAPFPASVRSRAPGAT